KPRKMRVTLTSLRSASAWLVHLDGDPYLKLKERNTAVHPVGILDWSIGRIWRAYCETPVSESLRVPAWRKPRRRPTVCAAGSAVTSKSLDHCTISARRNSSRFSFAL